jgi:feruloyl esterase
MQIIRKTIVYIAMLLPAFLGFMGLKAQQNDAASDSLRQKILALKIPGLTINDIRFMDTGAYQPAGTKTVFAGLPAFCMVAVTLQPTPASNIKVELWMPRVSWNGRFLGTGNGGGAGKIAHNQLAHGLKKGYATANTDMGTSPGVDSAIGHPERWVDFGYRATHLMTVVSRQILQAYYGKAAHHAYFMGCSTGGQQALMEAQRYPGDYNGIIAGAPANNRTHLHSGFVFNHLVTHQTEGSMLSPADLSYITQTVV